MTETLKALYSTVMTIYDLFSALSGWLGFRAVVASAGIFFFYRIFRNFFPKEKSLGVVASLILFTALWAAWNQYYSQTYNFTTIAETYAFLFAHVLALFLIQLIVRWLKKAFRTWRLKRRPVHPLELYEEVDESVIQIKQAIKEENLRKAVKIARNLEKKLSYRIRPPASESPEELQTG